MGYQYIEDGHCKFCHGYTHFFCDICRNFICEEHTHKVKVTHGSSTFLYCPHCFKKKRSGTH